jgi:hypothetical protein
MVAYSFSQKSGEVTLPTNLLVAINAVNRRAACMDSFVGTRRRKLCGQQIFGPQNFKTHVIIQNAENSSKISFSTHRSYCHATYFGEQGTSHSKVILPTAESTAQGEDSSSGVRPIASVNWGAPGRKPWARTGREQPQ